MYYYVHVHVHVHVYQYFIFSALKIFYAAIRNDNGYRPDSPELMKVIQCVCVCVCVCVFGHVPPLGFHAKFISICNNISARSPLGPPEATSESLNLKHFLVAHPQTPQEQCASHD